MSRCQTWPLGEHCWPPKNVIKLHAFTLRLYFPQCLDMLIAKPFLKIKVQFRGYLSECVSEIQTKKTPLYYLASLIWEGIKNPVILVCSKDPRISATQYHLEYCWIQWGRSFLAYFPVCYTEVWWDDFGYDMNAPLHSLPLVTSSVNWSNPEHGFITQCQFSHYPILTPSWGISIFLILECTKEAAGW